MSLVNLQTDLKSLSFGRDKKDGGSSNQPYITDPTDIIPDSLDAPDFLLRGGLNAPDRAIDDVKRLTEYFGDLKSPNGFLFVAKQNILSLTGVRTQAAIFGSPGPNEGVYTPLSTLAQAGGGFLGVRVPKQGLVPGLGVRLYGPKSPFNPVSITAVDKIIGGDDGNENRLVQLTNLKINKSTPFEFNFRKNQIAKDENSILSYVGGPKAPLGIGRTRIQLATDNKGVPLGTGLNSPAFNVLKGGVFNPSLSENSGLPIFNASLVTLRSYQNQNFLETFNITPSIGEIGRSFSEDILQGDIKSSTIMSISPSYINAKNTIDGSATSRINYLSPGQRGNIINYTVGKKDGQGNNIGAVDKINSLPIYTSDRGPKPQEEINDLIQFKIATLNKINPNIKDYIHFRAYLNDFSDKYSGKWNSVNYMGRAESFYKYNSFERDISLSFTVAAQSREELMIQYKKLNYLVSNLAPAYSTSGYIGGPLVELTVGGWCYELPGFIQGLSLGIPKQSPWEIGINTEGTIDNSIRELPHIVEVSGFQFTPIHKFRPEKQILNGGDTSNKDVTSYGNQHYISLANREDDRGIKGYSGLAPETNPEGEDLNINTITPIIPLETLEQSSDFQQIG